MNKKHSLLFGEIKSVVDSDMDSDDVLRFVCQMLHDGVDGFDWVGIYRYNEEEKMQYVNKWNKYKWEDMDAEVIIDGSYNEYEFSEPIIL